MNFFTKQCKKTADILVYKYIRPTKQKAINLKSKIHLFPKQKTVDRKTLYVPVTSTIFIS